MKSGGFDEITAQFEVEKLHQHSHLYTSDAFIDFPGRAFEIENSFTLRQIKIDHEKHSFSFIPIT